MPVSRAGFTSRFLYGTSHWNGAVLAALAVIFAVFATWLFVAVSHGSDEQIATRAAQNARALIIKLQLDEEAGLRAYAQTHDRSFLQPFDGSAQRFAADASKLKMWLTAAGFKATLRLVDEESAIHTRWLKDVARPVMAGAAKSDTLQRGKPYIDRFLQIDDSLNAALDSRAAAVDQGFRRLLLPAIFLTGFMLIAVFGAALYYGARQAQMMHRIDVETQRADAEKRIADQLQEAFQQQQLPSLSNLRFSATYMPASSEARVGGDWYDAFVLPDGCVMFSIGDVAGHGIDAAVTMSRARQTIIAASLQERDPGAVLAHANLTLLLQHTKFATAICGFVDPRTLAVSYANAGHPQGIFVTKNGVARLLDHAGLPLSVAHDAAYASFNLTVEPGSMLILYTDGILEYNRDLIFGEERLLRIASDVAKRAIDNPASAIRDAVFTGYEPGDDVAIMTIKFAEA